MEEPHGLHRPLVEHLQEALLVSVLLVDDPVLDALQLLDFGHCEEGLHVFELLGGGVDFEELDVLLLRLPLLGELELGHVHIFEGHVDELFAAVGGALVEGADLHDLCGEVADELSLFVFLNGRLDVFDVGPADRRKVFEANLSLNDAVGQ